MFYQHSDLLPDNGNFKEAAQNQLIIFPPHYRNFSTIRFLLNYNWTQYVWLQWPFSEISARGETVPSYQYLSELPLTSISRLILGGQVSHIHLKYNINEMDCYNFSIQSFVTFLYHNIPKVSSFASLYAVVIVRWRLKTIDFSSRNYLDKSLLTHFYPGASRWGYRECKPHLHVNLKIYQLQNFLETSDMY